MKRLLFLMLLLPMLSTGQSGLPVSPSYFASPKTPTSYYWIGSGEFDSSLQMLPRSPNFQPVTGRSALRVWHDSLFLWSIGSSLWVPISEGNGTLIPAGAFTTSNTAIGFNPGTNLSATDIINAVFYGEAPPTITLTGGTSLELTGSATVTQTLSINACRGINTTNIIRIGLGGTDGSHYNITFSNPALNACTGTINKSVTFPANTNITFTDTVTTQSGKQATANSIYTFLPRRYYGLISDTTGIGTTGYNNAILLALQNDLTASKTLTNVSTGTPSGTQFWVYLYPASEGNLTVLNFNGFPSLAAMNVVTRAFTNSLGYVQNYVFYYTKNAQTAASTVNAQ